MIASPLKLGVSDIQWTESAYTPKIQNTFSADIYSVFISVPIRDSLRWLALSSA